MDKNKRKETNPEGNDSVLVFFFFSSHTSIILFIYFSCFEFFFCRAYLNTRSADRSWLWLVDCFNHTMVEFILEESCRVKKAQHRGKRRLECCCVRGRTTTTTFLEIEDRGGTPSRVASGSPVKIFLSPNYSLFPIFFHPHLFRLRIPLVSPS